MKEKKKKRENSPGVAAARSSSSSTTGMRFTPDNNIVPCIALPFFFLSNCYSTEITHTHTHINTLTHTIERTNERFVGCCWVQELEIKWINRNLIFMQQQTQQCRTRNDDTNNRKRKGVVEVYVIRKWCTHWCHTTATVTHTKRLDFVCLTVRRWTCWCWNLKQFSCAVELLLTYSTPSLLVRDRWVTAAVV